MSRKKHRTKHAPLSIAHASGVRSLSRGNSRALLLLVVLAFLALGVAYAVKVPKWEAPDEPAHYNFIAYLSEHGRLPVLREGDYPFQYLEDIKSKQFPDAMSIDPIRYESHQPPLYYAVSAPVYWATHGLSLGGRVVALRLLSLLFGALVLVVAYRLTREIFPHEPGLAVAASACMAFVPMYTAMTAAINNDSLSILLLAVILLYLVRCLRAGLTTRRYIVLGVFVGLALMTKVTAAYVALVLPVIVLALRWWQERRLISGPRRAGVATLLLRLACVFGPAAALSGWWFVRNIVVYSNFDPLGLDQNALVAGSQLRTGGFDLAAARHFFLVSYRSFFAQFGWMGILVDERLYQLLYVLGAGLALGLILLLVRLVRRPAALSPFQRLALALLAGEFLLVFLGDLQYNLTFVQPQGRYLFPAMVSIGLFAALSWRELWAQEYKRLFLFLLPVGLFGFNVLCLVKYVAPYFA